MKKALIGILVVILVLSLGSNIRVMKEKNRNKEIMISNLYSTIRNITMDLDSFTTSVGKNNMYSAKSQLERAAIGLLELDNQIKYGTMYLDNQLFHPGVLSFRFIGNALIYGTNINGKDIRSVFDDNIVSHREGEYISWLLKDLKSIVKELTLEETHSPNEKLSIQEINSIFR